MQCRLCSYEFCWVCGTAASYEHYAPFSIFGCGVDIHQKNHTGIISRMASKIGKYILILLALIVLAFVLPPAMLAN